LKTTRWICAKFFQGLGENTCLLQPALKSTATSLSLAATGTVDCIVVSLVSYMGITIWLNKLDL